MCNEPAETCVFFVDDSNIWIEAQKFAASGKSYMPKLVDSEFDPRLRIDVGNLIRELCRNRIQGASFLYGSRPPPNDLVWEMFEKFKFRTKIFDRAHNKEKEVDNSMSADMSSEATELRVDAKYDPVIKQQKANTTFVAITGDRDMLPAVRKVLACNIRVELWAWRSGMSKEYWKLDSQDGLLSVNFLDSIFENISYVKVRSTRRSRRVDPAQAIVLCKFADLGGGSLNDSVSGELFPLGRLFYITPLKANAETETETETVIGVEFPAVKNIEAMVLRVRELFEGKATVLSWPEYASRFKKELVTEETSNIYELMEAKEQHESVDRKAKASITAERQGELKEHEAVQGLNDPDNSGGWETVCRSNPGKDHNRIIRQTQRCLHGVRCRKKGQCGYRHSDEERKLFRDNPTTDFQYWKTQKCKYDHCFIGRKRCRYAHSRDEAWCRHCRQEGHYAEECRYKS
ncbi:hypothetical protein FQN54_002226 [Arachnomyces sp. PD_36]|nr:hypothetical protein FQN54_002226 [Arachnomyces sp. PD_36]